MANNAVSIFEAMGTEAPAEPSWADKALSAVGLKDSAPVVHEGVVSIFAAQGMEEPEPTTLENIGGFLHDPESWKAMGSSVAKGPKVGIAAADMLLGIPGQALGVGADFGARLYALASGESRKTSETAGQLAMEEIPEALTAPLQNLAKKLFGAEPISQEAVTQTIDAGANIVDQYTKGVLSAADAKSALNIVMLGAGVKGVEMGMKEAARPKKEVPRAVEETPVEEPAPTPPSLYERVAPEAKALTAEEAVAASKQRIKDMKAAVKAETPAEKAARLATTRLPETEATWTSGKDEIPVRVTGEPVKGQDGKMYTPIKQQGTSMLVLTEELKAAPKVEPQVGLPEPKVAPVAAEPQGPGVTPKTKLVEGKTLAELREPPSSLDTAIAKVKEGRGFSLSAEEVLSLNRVTRAGGKIVGTDGKSIGPALKQSGAVDPRMLAALGITSGAVALALQPEGIEKLSNLGLVGLGVTVMKRGEGTPLSALKESAHPYRWNTLEALPEGKIQFSKQEVLDRATKWPSEKKVLERVLGEIEGDKVSAKALMEGVLEESANWKLTANPTVKYADYGLQNIGRKSGLVYQTGEGVPAQKGATTIMWDLPEHMQMSDANHFSNARNFGHTRMFPEDGIQHVVEIQSDLAQHAKGAVPEAERPALMARVAELDAAMKAMRARTSENAAYNGDYMRLKLEARELANKLNATAIDSQLSPIIKNWPRQLIRHTLQDAAGKGEGKVRFASADTVAKVEGWPMEEGKLQTQHQGIYNRYAGEITRYLKGLGGVEVTDAYGHTWLEVPTKSVLDAKGRIEQVGAAKTELLAGIAAAGGVTAYLVANPDDAGKLAVLGLLGTVAAKGKGLKDVLETDLVQRVRGGDAAAFAELYRRTLPTVKKSLRSYERTGVDIEDVVQRTYEKVYKALEKDPEVPGGFRGDSSVETFAYRTAQNLAKNAVRDAKTKPQTVSLETEIGEGRTLEDTLGHGETPLKSMEAQALQEKLSAAMAKVDPDFRRAFEMRELEGMSYEDIAAELGVPVGTVRSRIFRAKEQLQHSMREYKGKETGKVDLALATAITAVGGGAAFGALTSPDRPLRGAIYGALAGGVFGTSAGRSALKSVIASPDAALGAVSTRLGNIAPELKFRLRAHEMRVLQNIEKANDAVFPFIKVLEKLPPEVKGRVDRALLNGDLAEIKKVPQLTQTYAEVQQLLSGIETQLKGLGRFKEGVSDYFPRIVKDFEGLKKALGQEAKAGVEKLLLEAEAKMMRAEKRSLTDVEESLIVNRYLFSKDQGSFQPGFAKTRKMENVPENLQQFYAPPPESLLRYISGAVNDIEIARFFGKDLASKSAGKKVFTNVEDSIGNLTARLMDKGELSHEQAMELRDILKARFEGGERGMGTTMANVRNLTNAGLLGNVASAATQVGDSFLTVYHQSLVPTLQSLGQALIGKQKITPKQLGLINHVAEELSEMGASGRILHNTLKYSGFKAIDMFAKGLNLNAALIKNTKLVSTEAGRAEFYAKYQPAFGEMTPKVIEDLQAKRITPEVEQLVFSELSDAQPISRAEMPEMYLKHPNGRILYQMKTYMIKQADVVRRDAYQEIASGEPKRILRGVKNLGALATVYAVSNVPGDVIKDWLSGREADPLNTPKLVENVLQTFGFNRYASSRIGEGKVVETLTSAATPPVKVLQDIVQMNPKAVGYIPLGGRIAYDRYFGGNERREIYETRLENKGLPKGTGKKLSANAKMYLRKKKLAKKVEELHK